MSTHHEEPKTDDKPTYDVFISHRSHNKPWVVCLARNLEARGYRVFLDEWALVPGRFFVDGLYDGLTQTPKGILVATPEAVDSGWVRMEHETMLARSLREPDYTFVPLVFGNFPDLPFLENVHCIDFRDPAPDAYRRAFFCLLCGLEDRAPGPDGTEEGELDLPEPIRPLSPLPPRAGASEQCFLDKIDDALKTNPTLLLLAQADCDRHHVIKGLAARAAVSYGEANTLLVTVPWSQDTELNQYFSRLGRQCRFEEEIHSAADFDDALDLRLSQGKRLFLVVTGFENGSEGGRRQLAGTLRSLSERYGQTLRVVLFGGERLAELKYGKGDLSLLNHAEELTWPELTVADVLAWQEREPSDLDLDRTAASEILTSCGGHPRLVRHCLQERRQQQGSTGDGARESSRDYHFVWSLFTPYRRDGAAREKICGWLAQDDLGVAEPWLAEPLLRRLFWSNLLVEREGRLTWRCGLLREVGNRVLVCTG